MYTLMMIINIQNYILDGEKNDIWVVWVETDEQKCCVESAAAAAARHIRIVKSCIGRLKSSL